MNNEEFRTLMHTLAAAWTGGDPDTAVSCFTDDIVYIEPPDRQCYVGRPAMYELSVGADPPQMSMTWHHLVFDPDTQIGCGEYTFRGGRQLHGVALVQVRDGRICRWREYQYADEADWTTFIGASRFDLLSPPPEN